MMDTERMKPHLTCPHLSSGISCSEHSERRFNSNRPPTPESLRGGPDRKKRSNARSKDRRGDDEIRSSRDDSRSAWRQPVYGHDRRQKLPRGWECSEVPSSVELCPARDQCRDDQVKRPGSLRRDV